MRGYLKALTVAAALAGAALFSSGPAQAGVSISIGVPGIGVYYGSGGYCDRWGCPGNYWNYPVYYGPVYYAGEWYRGPVYYRRMGGVYWYWVHGGWHRDHWRGRRPAWWYRHRHRYYYGHALGYDYYRGHGFRHDHDRHWRGDHWRGDHWRRRDIRHDRRDIRRDRRELRRDRHDRRHDRHEWRREDRRHH